MGRGVHRRAACWLAAALLTLGVGRAQEQVARTAAVLEFRNLVASSPLLGSEAAASVERELRVNGFTLTAPARFAEALAKLKLKPPFAPDALRSLGRELDVQLLWTGAVASLTELPGPPASVQVTVQVWQYEAATGELLHGGQGVGVATLAGRGARAEAVGEALDRAVAKSFGSVGRGALVTGAILGCRPDGGGLTINRGLKQGVTKGMLFDVFRTKPDEQDPLRTLSVKVGRIRAETVRDDDAECALVHGAGIAERDQVRQAFELPPLPEPIAPPPAAKRRTFPPRRSW